jgi:hypothetical protein
MAYGKIEIQMITHGYQDFLDLGVFQNVMSKLVRYGIFKDRHDILMICKY